MKKRLSVLALGVALVLAVAGVAGAGLSFGVFRDRTLAGLSQSEFGVGRPLARSSSAQVSHAHARANPQSLFTLAKGLTAHVVSTDVAPIADQITLWPNNRHPTWLIVCNETEDTSEPALQRVNIATGQATTIVSGTEDCDPTRITPWGTIIFAEEDGTEGRLYELIDPLNTTGVTLDRETGVFSGGVGADNLVTRTAMGRASFEGFGILPTGVTYMDPDDSDVGPKNGGPGDPYFKFIPDHLWTPGDPPITGLSQSPYVSGSWYGLRVGRGTSNYGQGREFGLAKWIPLPGGDDPDLEDQAVAAGVTGYYRPEDADLDLGYLKQGRVRVCGPDTGDEGNHLYGQVVCFTDGTLSQAATNSATPEVQPFEIGGTSQGINMPDNIGYQSGRGNWVINEDAETTFESPHNNDIWDCLPDGPDQDLLSDGCIRIASLNDLTAEWTGGIFDATGTRYFVSIQHNISGRGTIIEIDGWK